MRLTATRVGGVDRTWRWLMAIGMAGWSIGQLLWSWYQIVHHRQLPSPSPADIGYLSLPVFAVPALLVIAADSRPPSRADPLDGAGVAGADP